MEDDIPSTSSGQRYRELKSLSRQRLRLIWEMVQMGEVLNDAALLRYRRTP